MPPTPLRSRLLAVVNAVFGGNVNAAAKSWAVPVSTVHRILEGQVEAPRLDTLRQIAEGSGIPIAWLLGDSTTDSAQGGAPAIPEPYWLIISHHAARQRRARDRLERVSPDGPAARRLKTEFLRLQLGPFSDDPAVPALDHLLTKLSPTSERDLDFVRQWAELSSAAIEIVFDKIK